VTVLIPDPPLLAWINQDQFGEGHAEVLFAPTEEAAADLAEGGDIDGEIERAPQFDQWAPGPVPRHALLAAGWWFSCRCCSHRVSEDGCEDCAEELEEPRLWAPYIKGGAIYCSRACYEGLVQSLWEDRCRKHEDNAAGRSMVARRWPGATFKNAFRTGRDQVVFAFVFPGGKHGPAHLYQPAIRGDEQADAWSPPARETLLVPQGDVDAWHAFEDTILAAREAARG
jgi:hypothetical protein